MVHTHIRKGESILYHYKILFYFIGIGNQLNTVFCNVHCNSYRSQYCVLAMHVTMEGRVCSSGILTSATVTRTAQALENALIVGM